MEFTQYAVNEINEESEAVKTFVLVPEGGGKATPYRPGNFFLLLLRGKDGKNIFRPYSAASHPDEEGLRFCVKKDGIFTDLLWNLREGDSIGVAGPHGLFVLDGKDDERVFIAGGIGITPIRGMILQTVKEGKACALFHSAKTAEELTYLKEMEGIAMKNAGMKLFPSITREVVPSGWNGMKGRITVQALKERLGALAGKTFYICGSREMATHMARDLLAEGVPKEKVRKEEWG